MSEKVLLAGASGPLGAAVKSELTARGHDVRAVSRSGARGSSRLDVSDPDAVLDFVSATRPTSVVYLARPNHAGPHDRDVAVAGLRRFTEICAANGVERIVFASSAAIYGTDSPDLRREDEPVAPVKDYGQLKLASELALAEVAKSSDILALSLRIFNIYGPGFHVSLINRLTFGDGPVPVVQVSDSFVRDYVHCFDVATAAALALAIDTAEPSVINVGTGTGTSNASLLAKLPSAVFAASTDPEVASHSVASTDLLRSALNFQTTITLDDAIRDQGRYLQSPPSLSAR